MSKTTKKTNKTKPTKAKTAKQEPKVAKPAPKKVETEATLPKTPVVVEGTRTDYEPKPVKKAKPIKIKPLAFNQGSNTANPAHLSFPTDRWGVTKDLRAAMISVASRIAGNPDKKKLVDETIKIGLAHIEAKFEKDHEYRLKKQAEAELEAEKRAAERKESADKADKDE